MPTGSLRYKILAICHDPKTKSQLADEIKGSVAWCKYFKSVWLVATTETPEAICGRLRPKMPEEESLFVMEVGQSYGYLPREAWDWIKEVRNAKPPQSSTG